MVVIGGAGSRWGAVLGGILYTTSTTGSARVGSSSTVQGLPDVLRTPLEQPLFLLGTIFILIVFFLPGRHRGPRVARAARAACGGSRRPSGPARSGTRRGGAHRAAGGRMTSADLERRAHRVRGAGHGRAVAARPGARLRPPRLGARAGAARGATSRSCVFDNRGFGESDVAARAVHDRAARRATRSPCSTRRRSRARTCSGSASAG